MNIFHFLKDYVTQRRPIAKPLAAGIAIFLALLVAFCDYYSGPELAFNIFYVLVVGFYVWSVHAPSGYALSILLATGSVYLNKLSGYTYYDDVHVVAWNMVMRSSLYLAITFILASLKDQFRRERDTNRRLARAYEEVKKAGQAKDRFTASVTHELRTPLTAIKESVAIVYDGLAGPVTAEQKEYLDMCRGNADRLNRLVGDILDFAKLGQGKRKLVMEEADLGRLIEEVVQFQSPVARAKKLELRYAADPDLPRLMLNPDAITQVVLNLIHNAVKFTEVGYIEVAVRKSKAGVNVSVRDTGPGIPAEAVGNLFRPFEQVPNREGHKPEGTGLGLAICREIIHQHAGEISAESDPGRGMTVSFTLPFAQVNVIPLGRPTP